MLTEPRGRCLPKGFPFGKHSYRPEDVPAKSAGKEIGKQKARLAMTVYGYVRCSTDKQTVLQQIDALKAAGCERIFRDKAVRATAKTRPGLLKVRKALRPGDTFVVTAIDRAFRSTIDAIRFLDDVITKDNITFRSLAQHIDTRTPEGRKWYIDAANNAEYERAVISRRTREKMEAAKARGKKFGRPRIRRAEKTIEWAREALSGPNPKTYAAVARKLRISQSTLRRRLA